MFITELAEPQFLVIYPGRFQPFHKGHHAVYEWLTGKFGRNNVYIATSNKTDSDKSPFSFSEKKYFMQLTGVPDDRIVQAVQPYQIQSILSTGQITVADPTNTVVIFAVSEKDMAEDPRFSFKAKKDGSTPYFQPLTDIKQTKSMDTHGYIMTVPTFDFTVAGKPMTSASEIRSDYVALAQEANPDKLAFFIKDLFGRYSQDAEQIMTNKLLTPTEVPAVALGKKTQLQKVAKPEPVAETVSHFVPGKPASENGYYKMLAYKYKKDPRLLSAKEKQELHDFINSLKTVKESGGTGVIASKKQAKDPRYSTSLTKDVRPGQIGKNLKAFHLSEEDIAWAKSRLSESNVHKLFAQHIEFITQDIEEIKNRIATEKLPAGYVEKLKQKIADLEQQRVKLMFNPNP